MNLKTKQFIFIISILILNVIAFFLAIFLGSSSISFTSCIKGLFNQADNSTNVIIQNIRLPRAIGGLIAGLGLGIAGSILQKLLQNDLASPNTVGVNAGAGLFVMIGLTFFSYSGKLLALFAFLGAFLTTLVIYLIGRSGKNKTITIILSGIAITALFNAIMKMMFIFYPEQAVSVNSFLIGTLENVGIDDLILPTIIVIVVMILAIIFSKALNILSLGDNIGKSLGLNVNFYRFMFIIFASLLAGSVVSFAGLLGFVGLIIPHLCKKIVGNNAKILMFASGITGSLLVSLCDTFSRKVFSPYEIPVGILTSLIGAPFFLYLILKRNK